MAIMKRNVFGACVLGIGFLLPFPASAHHSFAAEYDSAQPVIMTGAVTKIDWANPHVYFFIDIKDPDTGKVTNWAFEMGAPAVLTRSGWKRSQYQDWRRHHGARH